MNNFIQINVTTWMKQNFFQDRKCQNSSVRNRLSDSPISIKVIVRVLKNAKKILGLDGFNGEILP